MDNANETCPTIRPTAIFGVLHDYRTGMPLRPATYEEWVESTEAERRNQTGAFECAEGICYVED